MSENRWRNFLKHLRDLKTHISSSSSRIYASKALFNLLPTLFPMQVSYSSNSIHLALTLLCPSPPFNRFHLIKNKFRLIFSKTPNEKNFFLFTNTAKRSSQQKGITDICKTAGQQAGMDDLCSSTYCKDTPAEHLNVSA